MLFDEEILGVSKITSKNVISFDFIDKEKSLKSWVAKITGIDRKFGYKREFVKKLVERDSDDTYVVRWILENGFIYEYKNLLVSLEPELVITSGLICVQQNQLMSVDKKDLRKFLHMKVKGET